jgi:hypothetical protein
MARRAAALRKLLDLEKSTTKAVPYSEWPIAPQIIFGENDEFRQVFESFESIKSHNNI